MMQREKAREWLRAAYDDLMVAEDDLGKEWATNIVAFHAQQCVEKSLKSLMELYGLRIPKTHNLNLLLEHIKEVGIAPLTEILEENLSILDMLNEVYVETRYPGELGYLPRGKPSIKQAEEFYQFARLIFETVNHLIENQGF